MAQQGEINQNQNVQGLFTEGSPLNFPAGATVRDENFILNVDGSRERRLGIGQEPSAVTTASKFLFPPVFVFNWDAVSNDGSINYLVVIDPLNVTVYDKAAEPLSSGIVFEGDYGFTIGQRLVSGTAINGDFVISGIFAKEILVLSYEDGAVVDKSFDIKVRDIWGVDDPLKVDERPDTLSAVHSYNLANQGWKWQQARQVRDVGITTTTVTNPDTGLTETVVEDEGGWPSNADLVTYGISETDTSDRFKQELYSTVPFGTTPAPKGAAVISLLDPGQDRYDFGIDRGYGSLLDINEYNDYTNRGPKACAAYAGRVFFAGFSRVSSRENETYPDLTSTIAFSRSVQNKNDIAKCYQEADPTTLDSEIVASDGGTLSIAGTGFIYKLMAAGRSLLIFASEGVWELYSTDQIFSATNYQVRKLTDVGCDSPRSIIMVENVPMYWTDYGIYALQPDQVSESFAATNITSATIQSFYEEIAPVSVRSVFGFYDKFDKKARWLYSSDPDEQDYYDRELVFDSRLQSWYTNVYPRVANKYITGIAPLNVFSEVEVNLNVAIVNDRVVVGSDPVVVDSKIPDKGRRSFKYIVSDLDSDNYTFYEFNQADFKDFGTTDAEAVMITGPYTGGDSVRRKSSSYLTMQFRKTETGYQDVDGNIEPVNPSSCIVETRWDWTDLAKAGKFNNPIEMYRHRRHYIPTGLSDEYEDGNTVVTTKSRLRGSGRSLALKITSSPEKDLSLLGYNVQISQNQKV